MDFYYVVRRSPEWACGRINWDDALAIRDMWDRSFNVSYMTFRRFLNDLREENLKNTKFKKVYDSYDPALRRLMLPGKIVFPIDDDDWFHDDILDIIEPLIDEEGRAYRWQYVLFEKGVVAIQDNDNIGLINRYLYQSNNFCLKTPWYATLLDHTHVNRYYAHQADERYLDVALSVHNRNLASRSLWWFEIHNQEQLFEMFEKCKQDPPSGAVPPVFEKYVDRMQDFYRNRLKIQTKRKWL